MFVADGNRPWRFIDLLLLYLIRHIYLWKVTKLMLVEKVVTF